MSSPDYWKHHVLESSRKAYSENAWIERIDPSTGSIVEKYLVLGFSDFLLRDAEYRTPPAPLPLKSRRCACGRQHRRRWLRKERRCLAYRYHPQAARFLLPPSSSARCPGRQRRLTSLPFGSWLPKCAEKLTDFSVRWRASSSTTPTSPDTLSRWLFCAGARAPPSRPSSAPLISTTSTKCGGSLLQSRPSSSLDRWLAAQPYGYTSRSDRP